MHAPHRTQTQLSQSPLVLSSLEHQSRILHHPSSSIEHSPSLLIGQFGSTQVRPIHRGVVKAVLRGTGAAGVSGTSLFSGLGRLQLGRSFYAQSETFQAMGEIPSDFCTGGRNPWGILQGRGGVSGTYYVRGGVCEVVRVGGGANMTLYVVGGTCEGVPRVGGAGGMFYAVGGTRGLFYVEGGVWGAFYVRAERAWRSMCREGGVGAV